MTAELKDKVKALKSVSLHFFFLFLFYFLLGLKQFIKHYGSYGMIFLKIYMEFILTYLNKKIKTLNILIYTLFLLVNN